MTIEKTSCILTVESKALLAKSPMQNKNKQAKNNDNSLLFLNNFSSNANLKKIVANRHMYPEYSKNLENPLTVRKDEFPNVSRKKVNIINFWYEEIRCIICPL